MRPITPHEQEQFNLLYHCSYRRMYLLAYRLTGNAADAEDLAQDAFIRAWNHFDRFRADGSFEGWLSRILTNRAIDQARRKKRVPIYSLNCPTYGNTHAGPVEFECADTAADPERIVVDPTIEEQLETALSGLPTTYRAAIRLCYVDQHSYKEIAAITQCAMGTVRSRIHRARQMLRQRLEDNL